jgi:polar amino acid transport system substrate-binding protein
MKALICSLLLLIASPILADREAVNLGNEPWPPYVLSGEQKGTAEQIVCEALDRAGWGCDIQRGDWEETLQRAVSGDLDGIAALWHTDERADSLLFSRAYLTNRLVPVVLTDNGLDIKAIDKLSGLRVVTEVKVAYGDELKAALDRLRVVEVRGVDNALRAVQNDEADVALVDELAARDFVSRTNAGNLTIGQTALSYRELYFAVSKKHPNSKEVIDAFNLAYQSMLKDGTVNRILDIEWVVTDLKFDGVPDFIHRGGDFTVEAGSAQSVYPIGQKDYQMIRQPGFNSSNANFQVQGKGHNTTGTASRSGFEKENPCFYNEQTARIVCPVK